MKTGKMTKGLLNSLIERVEDGEDRVYEYLRDDMIFEVIRQDDGELYKGIQLRDSLSIVFGEEYVIDLYDMSDDDLIKEVNYVINKIDENGIDEAIAELRDEGAFTEYDEV